MNIHWVLIMKIQVINFPLQRDMDMDSFYNDNTQNVRDDQQILRH